MSRRFGRAERSSLGTDLSPRGVELVNILPTFWAYWEHAHVLGLEEQVDLFKHEVVSAHPEFFSSNVIGRDHFEKSGNALSDDRLRHYLKSLPPRIETMRHLSNEVETSFDDYAETFRHAFPDMAWQGMVCFTISVDAFDGALREVDGHTALLFGVDKIAKLHGPEADLQPLFHHELFHVYHNDINPPDPRNMEARGLLEPLWREGLAVFVARSLNPSATWSQLVLGDEMVRECEANLPALAAELSSQLDASTDEEYRDFFLGSGARADLPTRSGYFVGLKVAEIVARGHGLYELTRLRGSALRTAVQGALDELAGG